MSCSEEFHYSFGEGYIQEVVVVDGLSSVFSAAVHLCGDCYYTDMTLEHHRQQE